MGSTSETVQAEPVFSFGKLTITKRDRLAFLSALAAGLLVHLYILTNKVVNIDDVVSTFTDNDFTASGRWFLKYLSALSGTFSMPWLIGLISLSALACAVVCTVRMLDLKKTPSIILAAFAMVSFPSIGNTFAYMYTADAYLIALAMAALAVLLCDRLPYGWIPAACLLACSMGAYQAYVCFAIALYAIRYVSLLLGGGLQNRQALTLLGRYALSLALGGAMYYGILQLALKANGLVLNSYMGISSIGSFSLSTLPASILSAYREFFRFAFLTSGRYSGLLLSVAHLAAGILIAVFFMILLLRAKALPIMQKVFAVGVLLLMPLLLNSIYLFGSTAVHILMIYSITGVYLLLLTLAELLQPPSAILEKPKRLNFRKILTALSAVCVFVSSLCWTRYTNEGYFMLELKYDNMYAMAVRVLARIENDPAYTPDMPVTVIGDYFSGNYDYSKGPEFGDLDYAMGFGGAKEYDFLVGEKHFKEFTRVYLGVKLDYVDAAARRSIQNDARFLAMPCFPDAGSIQVFDGILAVKVGEVEDAAEFDGLQPWETAR